MTLHYITHIHVYVYIYIYTRIPTYLPTYLPSFLHTYMFMQMTISTSHICIHVYVHTLVYTSTSIHICPNVCMYVCNNMQLCIHSALGRIKSSQGHAFHTFPGLGSSSPPGAFCGPGTPASPRRTDPAPADLSKALMTTWMLGGPSICAQ